MMSLWGRLFRRSAARDGEAIARDIVAITSAAHGEIDIPRVRGVLYQLRALGMEFGLGTFDTYGSSR